MSTKKLLFGLVLGVVSILNVSIADPYFELKTGACVPQKTDGFKFRTTINSAIEFGYRYEAWRLGLQLSYAQFDVKNNDGVRGHYYASQDKSRSYALSGLINVYRDFALGEHWKCYLGLGIGGVRYRVFSGIAGTVNVMTGGWLTPPEAISDCKYILAYQISVGVAYAITDAWEMVMGYRLMSMENFNVKKDPLSIITETKIKTPLLHTFEVGIRYNF